mmetsp:Transcript_25693/g.96739  ORF Transcript_25693/g.96739 Transcript_25693/m.96739 type:complete len:252 (-) Transcript_25693:1886-2641(-)
MQPRLASRLRGNSPGGPGSPRTSWGKGLLGFGLRGRSGARSLLLLPVPILRGSVIAPEARASGPHPRHVGSGSCETSHRPSLGADVTRSRLEALLDNGHFVLIQLGLDHVVFALPPSERVHAFIGFGITTVKVITKVIAIALRPLLFLTLVIDRPHELACRSQGGATSSRHRRCASGCRRRPPLPLGRASGHPCQPAAHSVDSVSLRHASEACSGDLLLHDGHALAHLAVAQVVVRPELHQEAQQRLKEAG